jgi:ATP-binding cassette subfamily B protein
MSFPYFSQYDSMDCGPTCLRIIAKYYGKNLSMQEIRNQADSSREGVSLLSLSQAAEYFGFNALGVLIDFQQLLEEAQLPAIISWNQNHFVVVYSIEQKRGLFKKSKEIIVRIADPAAGLLQLSYSEFMAGWAPDSHTGLALLLEVNETFSEENEGESTQPVATKVNFYKILSYLVKYKKYFSQVLIGLLTGGVLDLLLPVLTQSVVDIGIVSKDINFVYLVLIAQLMVFAGHTAVEFSRNRLLLFISSRVNLSILSDFFSKLMKLPVSFFDAKAFGDVMQRISDHYRIDNFLTSNSISVLFSLFTLLVFGGLMAYYDLLIFIIFFAFSVIYIVWIMLFIKHRSKIDYKRFALSSKNQNNIIELLRGMQEIKLSGSEIPKLWQWERLQIKLFNLNASTLNLNQYQQVGSLFFNQGKTILITFLSARAVIQGELTLGQMIAIQYILGQLNAPIEQLIQFTQSFQDAKLSIERLNEIHDLSNEEQPQHLQAALLPGTQNIQFKDVSFRYPGNINDTINNVSFSVSPGKITAIVGMSGSGKSTLLKLLLKFYDPTEGQICVGDNTLARFSHAGWRKHCGAVLQDGYIFSDTIANNIALGAEKIDYGRVHEAVHVANIQELIENLPLGLNTKIGSEGVSLSQGQRQRVFIARAVYKNPDFLFFDEATSALDSTNENVIVNNLNIFFENRTVIIVAHRLSTVKKADHIIVLEKGSVVEEGNHASLVAKRGRYYNLVEDQLELAE